MSDAFELEATSRADVGKGASRRLRRLEGKIPAIVYGGKEAPVNITLDHDDLWHHLENEAFFSHIINLKIDGSGQDVERDRDGADMPDARHDRQQDF